MKKSRRQLSSKSTHRIPWGVKIPVLLSVASSLLAVVVHHNIRISLDLKGFKRDNPLRFRSNSNYEEMLEECKLHKLGIDTVMFEMKLRGEFRCTPLLRKAKRTWGEAGFDHAELIEEAAAEPAREEADAMPQFQELVEEEPVVGLVEEEFVFDQADVDEEWGGDEEEVEPPPKKSRTRRRNDVSCLKSQLGRYWDAPRSTRSRKEPKRYGCSD
mmetsp:Transcript_6225/g.9088  ORF Transcript_6225/g.9088 Transcript_6225/m.9088 type:complete len:214 (+) Transcript_6225:1813-2454(+)